MKKLLLKSLIGLVLPFNLVWAGDPASPPTDPFEAAVSGLRIFRPVGDIEGMGIHFKKLAEDGVIQWNEQMQRWDLKSDKYTLIFNGDYMRRGPYGTQIVKWILDLKTRYPRAIEMNIGNHDGNILSWHIMRPELKLGLDADYVQWLAKNGKANTLSSQMFFWAEDQGLTDKLENYWLEMALSKTRPKWFSTEERMKSLTLSDVEEARFFKIEQKSWGPTKVINRDALSALVPIEEMAKSFEDMVLPNGSGRLGSWRILEKGKIDGVAKGSDRSGSPVLIEFFHSGISTIDNLGVIPADGGRYVQVKEGQELIEDLPAGLDPKNPDHLKYFLAWQKRLNGTDKLTQLRALEMAIAEVNRLVPIDGNTPLTGAALARVKELVAQMKRNPLPAVLDANWARKLGDLFFRTSSRIYPDPRNLVENSLPSPADPAVLAAEARIGIKIILGCPVPPSLTGFGGSKSHVN